MRFASLGSGSRGNATLVEWDDCLLLVDCGFTIKETERRMQRLGRSPEQITAILVTHEHSDHIKGVAPLARKYSLSTHMTRGTYKSRDLGVLPSLQLIEGHQPYQIRGIEVQPVAVPHDAREPTQFIFRANGCQLGILTDLGSVTPHVEECYRFCDGLVLEANHDTTMLAYGPYPPSLKQRVGGPWGHLNNQQASGLLARLDIHRLQCLVIAHISQKNNAVDLVQKEFTELVAPIPRVQYACQEEGFAWQELASVPGRAEAGSARMAQPA